MPLVKNSKVNQSKNVTAKSLNTYTAYSDEELCTLVARGQEKAFEQLYDRYWNKVYHHAITYFDSEQTAKDIVQDIFLKLWDIRVSLKGVKNFESYIFIMSRNRIMNTLRQSIRHLEINPEGNGGYILATAADQIMIDRQLRQQLNAALQKLPARQQLVYKLSREEGLAFTNSRAVKN